MASKNYSKPKRVRVGIVDTREYITVDLLKYNNVGIVVMDGKEKVFMPYHALTVIREVDDGNN